jgi:hypothetical protein
LQVGPGGASLDRAGWIEELQGGFLVGVGVAPTVVVHPDERLAFGEGADDEGVLVGE